MILCCKRCGQSFDSSIKDTPCNYCGGVTEILLSDSDLAAISPKDIFNITSASKEKYKTAENSYYDPELWKSREYKDDIEQTTKTQNEYVSNIKNHLTTTGYDFQGYIITDYHQVISGSVVMGTGFFSELSASLDDLLGTTSTPFEKKMERVKEIALDKLIEKSVFCGGNAIIGIDFDFMTIGVNMIAVSANGTSVSIKKEKASNF